MFYKINVPEEGLIREIEEEINNFIKEIENLKVQKIEKLCKENLQEINLDNFFKLFPKNYLKLLKYVFEESKGKLNIKSFLLKKLKEENFSLTLREKAKDLEEYFLYDFIEKNLDSIITSIENYFLEKNEKIEMAYIFDKIKGLYGESIIQEKIENLCQNLYWKYNLKEISNIFKRFEKNLEENFDKIKEKIEIPPLLIFQMGINSLNLRYPKLFKNLSPEKEKILKELYLKLKKRGLILCYLYSFTKYFINEGIIGENPKDFLKKLNLEELKNINDKFFMGMKVEAPLRIDGLNIIKKSYIFKKIIIDKDFKIFEIAEEEFEDDEDFLYFCREKIYKEYEEFAKRELFPFIKENSYAIPYLRNLFSSPSFFSHNEILPFYKIKEHFLPFLEKDEIKVPFKEFEEKKVLSLKNKIYELKKDFSRIELEEFKYRSLKILEEISSSILFWEDFEILLEEFSKEFMHLPQIPSEVLENYTRLVYSYLSYLLNEAIFLDLPEGAKPQIALFETLNASREKGKIISLSDLLKKQISYSQWEEALFELKLSTPYRDFYNYVKKVVLSEGSLSLLKEIIEILQKEDFDLSISQKIINDISFLSEINDNEIYNLLLDLKNFPLFRNELKEKIFKIYPTLSSNLKNVIKSKNLYAEELEIEITRKEKSFLNFLKELKLLKSFTSFDEYLKIAKSPYKKEGGGFEEEFFIPIKHYLIQIEKISNEFFITLNVSGNKEGIHPFEGQRLKNYRTKIPEEIPWVIHLFQKYASFLLDLEEELFVFEYVKASSKQKYKIIKKKDEKVISFKRRNGKFQLKIDLEKEILKKIWAKAWGPFYSKEEDQFETEKDIRLILLLLKNMLS